jgi:hypothetical protein
MVGWGEHKRTTKGVSEVDNMIQVLRAGDMPSKRKTAVPRPPREKNLAACPPPPTHPALRPDGACTRQAVSSLAVQGAHQRFGAAYILVPRR